MHELNFLRKTEPTIVNINGWEREIGPKGSMWILPAGFRGLKEQFVIKK